MFNCVTVAIYRNLMHETVYSTKALSLLPDYIVYYIQYILYMHT